MNPWLLLRFCSACRWIQRLLRFLLLSFLLRSFLLSFLQSFLLKFLPENVCHFVSKGSSAQQHDSNVLPEADALMEPCCGQCNDQCQIQVAHDAGHQSAQGLHS
eukprot:Skav203367  [mRNA]  locus=scaffold940:310995:318479:+ [translate_table: standard]